MASDFCESVLEKCAADDYYELLGCDELSTTEQINAEFRHKVRKFHPDKNSGDDKTATKLFEKLKRARETLVDEEKKKSYDKWRRIGIAVPYETWLKLSHATHTSLHWGARPRKEPMLEYATTGNRDSSRNPSALKKTSENISSEPDNIKVTYYVTDSMERYARVGWKNHNRQISKFRRYEI